MPHVAFIRMPVAAAVTTRAVRTWIRELLRPKPSATTRAANAIAGRHRAQIDALELLLIDDAGHSSTHRCT